MSVRHLLVGSVVAAFGIAVAVSCSLRYDFTECTSDSDCHAFDDPANETFYTCGSDDTCRPIDDESFQCRDDADCEGSQTCNTSTNSCEGGMADAGDTTGDGGPDTADATGDADAVTRDCETTTECRNRFTDNHVCIDEQCQDVTSELCSDLFFPADNSELDDVVLLGSIIPETGEFETVGSFLRNAVQLAVQEFDGRPGTTLNDQRVGWLQCAAEGEPDKSVKAAQHLVDVGAPVIVGPIRSGSYRKVVEDVTGDAETVTIAPAATSPSLTNLEVAGTYSFRIIGNDRFQSQALLDRLNNLLADRNNFELTIFWKDDRYGTDFRDQIITRVSNASWIDSNNILYEKIKDPLETSDSDLENNINTKVTDAITNQPGADAAVFLGTGEMVEVAGTYIRAAFMQNASPERKRYIFSHGAVSDVGDLPTVLSESGNETFLPLTEGVTPSVVKRQNFQPFVTRYNTAFEENLSTSSAGVAYDAAALGLLGMTAVPKSKSVTGSTVSDVIAGGRLQDSENGTVVRFNSAGAFGDAKASLRNGGTIDIDGVSGNLDLNDKGDVRPNYLGTETGITFDVNDNRVYDIVPVRRWVVDSDKVAGDWGTIPPAFGTGGNSGSDSAGVTIPDDDSSGVTRSIDIQSGDCSNAVVAFADVGVDLDHPAPAELRVKVTAPATGSNGNPLEVLLREPGESSRPLKGGFPTSLIPSPNGEKFVSLLAKDGTGTWNLQVADTSNAAGSGTLNSWSLNLYCP